MKGSQIYILAFIDFHQKFFIQKSNLIRLLHTQNTYLASCVNVDHTLTIKKKIWISLKKKMIVYSY